MLLPKRPGVGGFGFGPFFQPATLVDIIFVIGRRGSAKECCSLATSSTKRTATPPSSGWYLRTSYPRHHFVSEIGGPSVARSRSRVIILSFPANSCTRTQVANYAWSLFQPSVLRPPSLQCPYVVKGSASSCGPPLRCGHSPDVPEVSCVPLLPSHLFCPLGGQVRRLPGSCSSCDVQPDLSVTSFGRSIITRQHDLLVVS